MLPNLVIIGAQKSASTFLQASLEECDDICFVRGECPIFEDPDYASYSDDFFKKFFPSNNRAPKYFGLKRPDYLSNPTLPLRLKKHLSNPLLLCVLREPVSRTVSAYYHYIRDGFIPNIDINEGLSLIFEHGEIPEHPRSKQIIEYSLYGKHLRNYLSCFKKEDILVLRQEQIAQDPQAVLDRVSNFLSLKINLSRKVEKSRPQAVVYNHRRLDWLRLKNRFCRNYTDSYLRYIDKENPYSRFLSKSITGTDRYILRHLFGYKKPQLNAENRHTLKRIFDEDEKILLSLGLPVV